MDFNLLSSVLFYAFLSIILLQVLYHLFFFLRPLFHKYPPHQSPPSQPIDGLSIIVPVNHFDENHFIKFAQILAQSQHQNIELVLVIFSKLNPLGLSIQNIINTFPNTKLVQLHQDSKFIIGDKYPLSIGIKSASYDHIVITKDNCLPLHNDWINTIFLHLSLNTEVVIGGVNIKEDNSFFNKFARFENAHSTIQFFSFALAKIPIFGTEKNLAFSRQIFYKNKGFSSFNDFVGGENSLLINQLASPKNTHVNTSYSSFLQTTHPISYNNWCFNKKAYLSTIKYFKTSHRFLIGTYVLSFIFFYILLLTTLSIGSFKPQILILATLRTLITYTIWSLHLSKFKNTSLIKWLPIMDIMLLFYYLRFGFYYFKNPKKIF